MREKDFYFAVQKRDFVFLTQFFLFCVNKYVQKYLFKVWSHSGLGHTPTSLILVNAAMLQDHGSLLNSSWQATMKYTY